MHVQHAGNLTKSTNKLWSEKRKLNFDGVQIQRGKVISESESWVDQVLFFPWRSLDIHFSYAIVFCCCAYRNTWRKTTPIGWMKIENEWIPSRGAMNFFDAKSEKRFSNGMGVRILLKKLFYLLSYSKIEMEEGDLTLAYRPIQVWKPVIKKLGYCIVPFTYKFYVHNNSLPL